MAGRGVSYCATCDAAFFKEATTIIVGGGDSAMEEAIFLSKFASKVTVVHRRDEFRASKIMLDRARAQENIEFLTPYTVKEFVAGESGALGHAVAAQRRDRRGARAARLGHVHRDRPRAAVRARARRRSSVDENGYVITEDRSTRTDRPGVFAAGDLVDHTYRQAITAAGVRLPGGARRGVVPARHARCAGPRGDAARRSRRGAVRAGGRLAPPPGAAKPG